MNPPNSELDIPLDAGSLAASLPDLPRWVELRADLLSGRGTAYGRGPGEFVALDRTVGFGYVVGKPSADLIRALGRDCREVLTTPEEAYWVAAALPEWTAEVATVHVHTDRTRLPAVEPGRVRLVSAEEVEGMGHLPSELRAELLTEQSRGGEIAAAFADGHAVAFCYGGPVTERWWDISIDTLASHRRQGHASVCVAHEIERFRVRGLEPIWGALASNAASFGLAARLGFTPHDGLVVLEAPAAGS